MRRKCNKCGETKDLSAFIKDSKLKSGIRPRCKDCKKAHGHEWHEKNKERKKLLNQAWYQANRDRKTAAVLEWRAQNVAKTAENNKRWKRENPERVRLGHSRSKFLRRSRLKNAKCDLTAQQWEMIKVAYKQCCAYCGEKVSELTQDHVIPVSKGGDHTAQNIVPACRSCNSRKHAKMSAGTTYQAHLL